MVIWGLAALVMLAFWFGQRRALQVRSAEGRSHSLPFYHGAFVALAAAVSAALSTSSPERISGSTYSSRTASPQLIECVAQHVLCGVGCRLFA
jgi:hypothetical protein